MSTIELTSADGFKFDAYVAEPKGTPHGAIVVIQEIFGVNAHIREVADGYAAEGYLAVAPAIFDRTEKNVQLGYEGADREKAMSLMSAAKAEDNLRDIAATIQYASRAGKVGIVGFCLGGRLSWQAAAKLDGLAAAVTYYGGGMPSMADLKPRCPVLSHFGAEDSHIPLHTVEAFRDAQPEVTVEIYPEAQHGFNCDHRASYDAKSAALARERTLAFFKAYIG